MHSYISFFPFQKGNDLCNTIYIFGNMQIWYLKERKGHIRKKFLEKRSLMRIKCPYFLRYWFGK